MGKDEGKASTKKCIAAAESVAAAAVARSALRNAIAHIKREKHQGQCRGDTHYANRSKKILKLVVVLC